MIESKTAISIVQALLQLFFVTTQSVTCVTKHCAGSAGRVGVPKKTSWRSNVLSDFGDYWITARGTERERERERVLTVKLCTNWLVIQW